MVVDRLKLINDVGKVLPGIATGMVTLEGADTLVFSDGHLYSYNSTVSVDVKLSEDLGFNGSVKAQEFYNCLVKLPGTSIDVEASDSQLRISDGKIHVSMKLLSVGQMLDALKSLKTSDDGWFSIDGKEFQKVLKICFIKDSSSISGIYFNGRKAYSTNRWIINKCELNFDCPEFWLSTNGVLELVKWDDFKEIKFEKQWLHLRTVDGVVFSLRTLCVDSYPLSDVERILGNALGLEVVADLKLDENFYKAIKRASVFSGTVEDHDTISISFGHEVKVLGRRISGDFEEVVEGMDAGFEVPVVMDFDIVEFTSSDGYFDKFKILSKDGNVDVGRPVNVLMESFGCSKLFTSLVN